MDDRSTRDWLLLIADALDQWPSLNNAGLWISSPAVALAALLSTLPPDDRHALIEVLGGGLPEKTFEEEARRLRDLANRLPKPTGGEC